MKNRILLGAALSAAMVASTATSYADEKIVGVFVYAAGSVAGYHVEYENSVDITVPAYTVAGDCTFAGALTPRNTLIVEFGGVAVATGPAGKVTPLVTAVTCSINNFAAGGTNSQERGVVLSGSTSVVADSTATSADVEWPVMPITVCVTAFGVWGPTPMKWVDLTQKCETP